MKRSLGILLVVTIVATAAALVYQAAARDTEYRSLLGRGDAAFRADQTFGAIEAYSNAIVLRPDSTLAHLRRGQSYQRRGDLDAAARDYQSAAVLDPTATRPLEELADVRYLQQRFARAGEVYEQYLRLDDRAPRVSYKLALARYRASNIGGALTALDQTLRLDERMTDAHYLRALCLRSQHLVKEAQRALERSIALAPGSVAPREELADLHGALGRRTDQLEQLQVLAVLDRDHIERQITVGMAHARWAADLRETPARRATHADLAILTLGSALERSPDQPLVYGALGRVWLEIAQARGDRVALNKALEALEHVASSPSPTSDLLTLYGRALLQTGHIDLAERTLQDATARYPVDPVAFLFYAETAEQRNHLEPARRALLNYDALAGDDEGLASRAPRVATLALKLSDRATAAKWLGRGLEKEPTDATLLDLQHRLNREPVR